MNESSEIRKHGSGGGSSGNFRFPKGLVALWKDLQDDDHWRYEELSPVQLLEKLNLDWNSTESDELARAEWFWSRRPRFLLVISRLLWLIAALGMPFWLFVIPKVGVPILVIWAVTVATEIVRSVRWRRQYELSIDRLIRISGEMGHEGKCGR